MSDNTAGLSAEELAACAQFGVTPEEFAEVKAILVNLGWSKK